MSFLRWQVGRRESMGSGMQKTMYGDTSRKDIIKRLLKP